MALVAENTHWSRPSRKLSGTGVLVLAGSSGRIDKARVDYLAHHGVTALGLRWFGGTCLPPSPAEVPVEYFMEALDRLADECDRLAIVGLSYGAEAALLTAAFDPRPLDVVAIAPTDVAWEGDKARLHDPATSKWTVHGEQVPFVPFDHLWQPPDGKPAFVDFYRHSRAVADPAVIERASIPVEKIDGHLVLVAGGDDRVWPSLSAARRILERRGSAGLPAELVVDEHAGHFLTFPGETAIDVERPYQVGGDDDAPGRLGALAWPSVADLLGIAS